MRRLLFPILAFILGAGAVPLQAQIGKQPFVRAGSPEDKAMAEIDAATDPAKKLELLDKFLAEFGQGDMALMAYERYIAHYLGEKNYEKAYEYGEKALAYDPDNFAVAFTLLRAVHEKGDLAKAFDYGDRIGAILQRFKTSPPPADTGTDAWEDRKHMALEAVKDQLSYVYYTLFSMAYQVPDAATKAGLLERYATAFPDSPHLGQAQAVAAGTLIVRADEWSERGEQLDQAEQYASKALAMLAKAQKPEQLTDEQWNQQKALQQGLAYSALGMVHLHKNRNPQALEAFRSASPLLKPDATSYGRNLYRLGFTLAKMQRTAEARTVLTEAVAVNSPYRGLAQETLNKIGGAIARPAKKRP